MYFNRYIDAIEENNGEITPLIANYIISNHVYVQIRMIEYYERYKTFKLPILQRDLPEETTRVNNKLVNNFFGEIVDTKIGYMFGEPVTYFLDRDAEQYDVAVKKLEQFRKLNNLDDLNAEMGRYASMCGYAANLCYIDQDGQERVMRVDPWECIFISNYDITEPKYAIRYYWFYTDNGMTRQLKVMFYDSQYVTTFVGDHAGALELVDKQPHMFDYVPLFGIPNNGELQNDIEKVHTLIDAYDRSISDMNSEIEEFRMAYTLFIGYEPTEETLSEMRRTGALYIPDAENGEDIKFLTKQLDYQAVDSHLDRLEKNIVRFANHIDFTDDRRLGNLSGVAMRYKLFALETKSKMLERKHEAATRYMFKVIASAWAKKGFKFDPSLLDIKYTRNIPVNIADEADGISKLNGIVSKKTLLGQLSFVNDVEEELQNIEDEKNDAMNLDDPSLLDGNDTGGNENNGFTGGV